MKICLWRFCLRIIGWMLVQWVFICRKRITKKRLLFLEILSVGGLSRNSWFRRGKKRPSRNMVYEWVSFVGLDMYIYAGPSNVQVNRKKIPSAIP